MPTRKSYLVGLPFVHKNTVFGVIFVTEGSVTRADYESGSTHIG